MKKAIDPSTVGLSSRTVLSQIKKDHIAIVKDRKSRIIMKDGEQIRKQAETIRENLPGVKVSLQTGAPVCSKTTEYLADHDIAIIPL